MLQRPERIRLRRIDRDMRAGSGDRARGGTIAAAIGCVLKPAPGTLSNTAASALAAVYGVGFS